MSQSPPTETTEACVKVKKGTEFGFRPTWTSKNRETVSLARVANKIRLKPGFHLLLARNGRGKTTFLKTVAGCLAPLAGDINVTGQVQYLSEDLKFDPELTPRRILNSLFDKELLEVAGQLASRLELPEKNTYETLSKGNRQKLSIIISETMAASAGPQVLLMDEPFSGVDFHIREEIGKIWNECERKHIRVICLHPDEPTLKADGALVITDNELNWRPVDGSLDWLSLKPELN